MPSVPGTEDPNVRRLAEIYEEAERELSGLYDDLLAEDEDNRSFEIVAAVLAALALLTQRSEVWAETAIPRAAEEADRSAINSIQQIRPGFVPDPGVPTSVSRGVQRSSLGFLFKARGELERSVNRLLRSTNLEQDYPAIAAQFRSGESDEAALDRKIRRQLAKNFREKPVELIGSNGRTFSFSLPYYAAMVAHNARHQVQSFTAVTRAREAGLDLVQISNNPSTHADWCNAYRGKVFSITGSTPGFNTLSQLPNGGAPFHPWCHHVMKIFNPEGKSQQTLSRLANVDEAYLLSPENDFNTMVRTWWARNR